MFQEMLIYFLAIDIFALTALIMALVATPIGLWHAHNRFLVGLFGLVMVKSWVILMYLKFPQQFTVWFGPFEILSLLTIAIALSKSALDRDRRLQLYAIGYFLISLSSLPLWVRFSTYAWQFGVILVASGSLPIIFSAQHKTRWSHMLVPLILALTAFLNWWGLTNLSYFTTFVAYGALICAVFIEIAHRAEMQQHAMTSLNGELRRLQLERNRAVEVSEGLHTLDNPNQILNHMTWVLAQAGQFDMVIILILKQIQPRLKGRVAAIFKRGELPDQKLLNQTDFNPVEYDLLLDVMETHSYVMVDKTTDIPTLSRLSELWSAPKTGPTLLQPMLLDNKMTGIIVATNPLSQRSIRLEAVRLLQNLAPQLAGLVAYHNVYADLYQEYEVAQTELKSALSNLAQLTQVIEAIDDGVIVSHANGKIQLANQASEYLLGKPRQDILGKPISTIYGQINATEPIEKIASRFSRNKQPLLTYFERNGLAVRGRLIPLRDQNQEWQGMVAQFRDITLETNADRAKSEFIDLIAKKLQTPLKTINGYINLMTSDEQSLTIQQQYFTQVIEGSANQMLEILNDAVHQTTPKTEALHLSLKPVNMTEVIQTSLEAVTPLTTYKEIRLNVKLDANLPLIHGDPIRLGQVLDNLLSNACRFTPEGGEISIHAQAERRGVNGQGRDYILLQVSDTGGEMSAAVQKTFREQPLRQPAYQHTIDVVQLGLNMVKTIVEAHGGQAWAEDIPQRGGVFYVLLPCRQD